MTRPDTYCLHLACVKADIAQQIVHCSATLQALTEIQADPNYDEAATELEKSNISGLITLISGGLAALQAIVWE
jgi:hypothetical protein